MALSEGIRKRHDGVIREGREGHYERGEGNGKQEQVRRGTGVRTAYW